MAIIKMNRIALLGLQSERARILEMLMSMGVVEVTDGIADQDDGAVIKPQNGAELAAVEGLLSEAASSIQTLKRLTAYKKPMFFARRIISENEFNSALESRDRILDTVREINSCDSEIQRLRSEENRQRGLLASLDVWMDLDFPLDVNDTRTTGIYFGIFPSTADMDELEKTLGETVKEVSLARIGKDRDHSYVLMVVHKSAEQEALSLIKSKGFNRIAFRDMEGTPKENRERILKYLADIAKERDKNVARIKALASERDRIEILHDALKMEQGRMQTVGKLVATNTVFLLNGWLPANISEKLKKTLEDNFVCAVRITAPDPDEETPVLVENGPVVEAIEPVFKMYGAPSSKEIDPSPVLMPFFVMFFGLMLGDGGYGLMLTAVTIFILQKKRLEDSTKRFMKLIMYCGIASIFWGAMFGSWFGLPSLSGTALWLVPTEATETLMSWSLLFGIIHMYTGLFLKALNLIRRKQLLDAVFDVLFMYILFTGFILTVISFAPGIDPNSPLIQQLTKIGGILFIVGAALVVLTAGRKSKKIFGKVLGGFGKLYDVVGFMGDTLSYMRLLAIGLAGSIISSIVNTMAASIGGNIIVTILGGGLIIIAGHAINIGMGLLGAFVHSCRLQYLEFFGKFLEGGGQYFRPFKAETKYIVVKPDIAKLIGNKQQALRS